jgi:NMD protein affecting ribosome stability and mRNA decay
MGFRRYRGPIDTTDQAAMADLYVTVKCHRCGHSKSFWTRRLIQDCKRARGLKLRETVTVFRCGVCNAREAAISTPVMWV